MRVGYFMRENPLYLDIAASIRNDILSQVLEPHTRLPSEPELVKRFGAARATVRRALAKLQDEGLIYAKQKVGSFVAEPRVEQDLNQLVSFTQFMVYRGMKPSSQADYRGRPEGRRPAFPAAPLSRPARRRQGRLHPPPAPGWASASGDRQYVAARIALPRRHQTEPRTALRLRRDGSDGPSPDRRDPDHGSGDAGKRRRDAADGADGLGGAADSAGGLCAGRAGGTRSTTTAATAPSSAYGSACSSSGSRDRSTTSTSRSEFSEI